MFKNLSKKSIILLVLAAIVLISLIGGTHKIKFDVTSEDDIEVSFKPTRGDLYLVQFFPGDLRHKGERVELSIDSFAGLAYEITVSKKSDVKIKKNNRGGYTVTIKDPKSFETGETVYDLNHKPGPIKMLLVFISSLVSSIIHLALLVFIITYIVMFFKSDSELDFKERLKEAFRRTVKPIRSIVNRFKRK